ncbi:hypothetical protein ND926_03865 [Vibrio diabolicus]|uniref:hypothetical protein n=1 Tax=Vibrio diabolicus TaxID=50719 RepID=UPI00215DD9B1|nr:hypothetical protein [Vibrio diabolicus]MCS0336596.1 hypothetical protein [Vibrio diabolicus]
MKKEPVMMLALFVFNDAFVLELFALKKHCDGFTSDELIKTTLAVCSMNKYRCPVFLNTPQLLR